MYVIVNFSPQVPQQEWETMMVVLVPVEAGRATVRSERVPVIDGMCQWANPIYETVKLIYDAKAGKINGKVYQVTVWASVRRITSFAII